MNLVIPASEIETYQAFLDEAHDHMDSMEERVLAMVEQTDPEQVHVIFRGLHSIKGVASFLGLTEIQRLAHQLESVFDNVRQSIIPVDEHLIQICLACQDHLASMLKNLESGLSDRVSMPDRTFTVAVLEVDYELDYQKLGEYLEGPKPNPQPAPQEPIREVNETDRPSLPSQELTIKEVSEEDLVTPEMKIAFARESEELLDTTEQLLLQLEQNPSDSECLKHAFRNIHSYKGNCGFFGFADQEKLAHCLESVLERAKEGLAEEAVKPIASFGLRCLDLFRDPQLRTEENRLQADARWSKLLEEAETLLLPAVPSPVVADSFTVSPKINLDPILLTEQITNAPKIEINQAEVERPAAPTKSAPVQPSGSPSDNNVVNRASQNKDQKRDLRVDVAKLDLLLDLVGELVIASGMVLNHPKLKDAQIPELDKVFHQLEGVVDDLQSIALGVRMIPIEGVFKKMTRLVHDLSQKCGKKVKLELLGEKTEVDKNVADLIADPLVHMIRNSIDHGLETPEEREANGKNGTGTIVLSAIQEGGDVCVEIHDDGRGMNRQRILAKALEKGLIPDDGREYLDEEVFQFIFLPGFSTAEAITSTSGRGVGMDVVKSNVEKLNGRITIRSELGVGTHINLRIPLTLSIIEGMQVRVGHSLFILPLLVVYESIAAKKSQITRTADGQELLQLRRQTFPIVRLHSLQKIEPTTKNIEEGILLRLEAQGFRYCLLVDEILGQRQTVVKALPPFIGQVPGVSACSILDSGEISLILDARGVWNKYQDIALEPIGTSSAEVGKNA